MAQPPMMDDKPMEKIDGVMYRGHCPDCGEPLFVFVDPEGKKGMLLYPANGAHTRQNAGNTEEAPEPTKEERLAELDRRYNEIVQESTDGLTNDEVRARHDELARIGNMRAMLIHQRPKPPRRPDTDRLTPRHLGRHSKTEEQE